MRIARRRFSSLDRQFSAEVDFAEPDRYRLLEDLPRSGRLIARGAGLSYVPASFGPRTTAIGFTRFDRILAFDPLAKTIEVEAGISLHKLHLFLAPRGLTVPVEPGHPQISVGGCIAFNVFGKNQSKQGLFETAVEELELFHPDRGGVRCSRTLNAPLFELTLGGMGLTGIVLRAKLRLAEIPSPWVEVEKVPVRNLAETARVLGERAAAADSLYSFNDFTSFGDDLGGGFVLVARFSGERAPAQPLARFRSLERRPEWRPAYFNGLTRPMFCKAYRFLNTRLKARERTPFHRFNYPVASTPFYFDWYGRRGFIERQILVPRPRIEAYIDRFERLAREHRPPIVFGSCKFFRGSPRLLNFSGDGMVISMDFTPSEKGRAFQGALDALNVELGALDNLAKDSRLAGEVVAAQYPGLREFRARLDAHDSGRRFGSALSDRILS